MVHIPESENILRMDDLGDKMLYSMKFHVKSSIYKHLCKENERPTKGATTATSY